MLAPSQPASATSAPDTTGTDSTLTIKQEEDYDMIDLTPDTTSEPISSSYEQLPVDTRGDARYRIPHGLDISGRLRSNQISRTFLVPLGVKRERTQDFPELGSPLEEGMVACEPGCYECRSRKIHCTFGAGVNAFGQTRDPAKGKCDYCKFRLQKCGGNGYGGQSSSRRNVFEHKETSEVDQTKLQRICVQPKIVALTVAAAQTAVPPKRQMAAPRSWRWSRTWEVRSSPPSDTNQSQPWVAS